VIDREKLTSAVTGVGEAPAYGWVPRGVANYTPQQFDYASKPYVERVQEARELYRAAGYSPEHPLAVEIRYNTGEAHNRLAVAVAAMWKDTLGVETTLYAEEFRALLQSIQARTETQVFRSSWVGDFNDAYSFAQLLQTGFGINLTGIPAPLRPPARRGDPQPDRRGVGHCSRSRARDAREPGAAALFLREQAPREAVCARLD
jgi:oligopeptide transport system substrate-binding protein